MSIRTTMTGPAYARFRRITNGKLDRKIDEVELIAEEVMADAANEMRHYISVRGVKNTVPNFNGRISGAGNSGGGHMIDAVDHKVWRAGDVVHMQFGWLPGRPREKRFGWQEDGTLLRGQPEGDPDPRKTPEGVKKRLAEGNYSTTGSPRGIRPMFALADANAHANEQLRARIGRGR